jgi:hypothetical protein
LFDRWKEGDDSALVAPLAVRDAAYRRQVVDLMTAWLGSGATIVSVGAGNGFAEVELAAAGWDVLATDAAESALRHCAAKGLRTAQFDLLADPPPGTFDAIYCDGVFGHLWREQAGTTAAWRALAGLGRAGSVALVSNDLADHDGAEEFAVRSSRKAMFYRPPAGTFARDAVATGRWALESVHVYEYERSGVLRRRELLVTRLLPDGGVVASSRRD